MGPAARVVICFLKDIFGDRKHETQSTNRQAGMLQAYGMMGWRTGYLAYKDQGDRLSDQLQKIQDTIPICPPQLSMHVALHAVKAGRNWVEQQLETLLENRCAHPASLGTTVLISVSLQLSQSKLGIALLSFRREVGTSSSQRCWLERKLTSRLRFPFKMIREGFHGFHRIQQ